ncbi:MAG TPA: FecR domain-containing protein [Opitutaceae bacterium]
MNSSQSEQDATEAAAEWLARADRGFTTADLLAFARWRAEDPRHEIAAAEIESVWGALDDLSAYSGQQRAGGVVVAPPASLPPSASRARAWWLPALSLAAAFVVAAVAWWNRAPVTATENARYATEIGEQRTVTLADGSTVRLNTHTAVVVRLTARERRVDLERGEAFFQVTQNPARPFVVAAGRAEVRVVGTAFSVRLREADSVLTVTEGRVQFGVPGRSGSAVTLGVNQQATLAHESDGAPRVRVLMPDDVARRLAWREGMLQFSNTPLAEAVAEFNRYHVAQLRLGDAAIHNPPLGGSFEASNQEGFIRLLETSFGVTVVERNAKEIVLGRP